MTNARKCFWPWKHLEPAGFLEPDEPALEGFKAPAYRLNVPHEWPVYMLLHQPLAGAAVFSYADAGERATLVVRPAIQVRRTYECYAWNSAVNYGYWTVELYFPPAGTMLFEIPKDEDRLWWIEEDRGFTMSNYAVKDSTKCPRVFEMERMYRRGPFYRFGRNEVYFDPIDLAILWGYSPKQLYIRPLEW